MINGMRSAPGIGIEQAEVVVAVGRGVIVSAVGALSGLGFRRQNKLKI